jgi:hypothetical protein
MPTHSPCSGQALKVGDTFACLRLDPSNLKTFPYPRRQNHDAVEKPQGRSAGPALHFLLRAHPSQRDNPYLTSPSPNCREPKAPSVPATYVDRSGVGRVRVVGKNHQGCGELEQPKDFTVLDKLLQLGDGFLRSVEPAQLEHSVVS